MRHETLLFDNQGRSTAVLSQLLELMGVQHDGTLVSIRDATQEAWYQAGKLRSEISDHAGIEDVRDDVLRCVQLLGCIDEVSPPSQHFEYAFLLGGTVVAVRKRLRYLMESESRFTTLVLMGSERKLLADKEAPDILFNPKNTEFPFPETHSCSSDTHPTNEIEMMHLVLKQSDFARLRKPVVTVCGQGRANTAQTIQEWLRASPEPGACLAASSQPFVSFQQIVIANELPEGFIVAGIGPAANPTLPVATFLDNVAKLIFELARAEGV